MEQISRFITTSRLVGPPPTIAEAISWATSPEGIENPPEWLSGIVLGKAQQLAGTEAIAAAVRYLLNDWRITRDFGILLDPPLEEIHRVRTDLSDTQKQWDNRLPKFAPPPRILLPEGW